MSATEKIARKLFQDWNGKSAYAALSGEYAVGSVDEAYLVQRALQRLHSTNRGRIVGRKIALSAKAMQEMIGVDHPIAGAFFSHDLHNSPARIRLQDFQNLGLEFELALQLGEDVAPADKPYTPQTARQLVTAVRPAFELIEDRNADYNNLDALTLIADNAWCGGVVLGEEIKHWDNLELGDIASVVRQDGKPDEHTNTGAADPLGSLAWILNHFSQQNIDLKQGEHIITGSAVRTRFPVAGDKFSYELAGASVSAVVV